MMRFVQNISNATARPGYICRRGAGFGRAALVLSACAALTSASPILHANAILNEIGFSALPTGLNGAGVNVGQIEASLTPLTSSSGGYTGTDTFEVQPGAVNQPQSLFTYIDANGNSSSTYSKTFSVSGSTSTITDAISSHANAVGDIFYGNSSGVAAGVAHVDNYDASWFENHVVASGTVTSDKVVNQSFVNVFPSNDTTSQELSTEQQIDFEYDNYTSTYGTIFVSAVGNGAGTFDGGQYTTLAINPPSTAYDSIAVAALNGSTVVGGPGPTLDGRCKPDLVAPGGETSYATPLVSGAAAILVQAGTGTNLSGGVPVGYTSTDGLSESQYTSDATDVRTVKALLLNGAVKPSSGWYHTPTSPLNPRYGSGIVNIGNSYNQLAAGIHPYSAATSTAVGTTPSFDSSAPLQTSMIGWNLTSITSSVNTNGVEHYMFNLPKSTSGSNIYDLTATLTWNAKVNMATGSESINNLYLYIINSANEQIAVSDSSLDNVQQLFVSDLIPGQYDLVVMKVGGVNEVSTTSTYSMAYQFNDPQLSTPEPATLGLLALGATPLFLLRRRKTAGAVAS